MATDSNTAVGGAFSASRFIFKLDGLKLERFKGVSGVEIGVEVRTSTTCDEQGNWSIVKTAGAPKTPSVRVTRGMEKSPEVTQWIKDVYGANVSKKKTPASIIFMTDTGSEGEKLTVNLINAWVSSWSASDLSSDSTNGTVDETFVIECERIEFGQ
ncbi:phage tail protein [Streptomyces sp. MS2.AVA.5]|uniref:Phage tail protein n=1 Tax=Streptomyces achmelvichensis TaxID=3134111 RepID=A0ACC6PKZ6_9ACTN